MDDALLYDEDIYAWSQRQAAVLRRLALRRDLPNELDLDHVVEEIEDVGLSHLNAVKSYVRLILLHLIKAASTPNSDAVGSWRKEVVTFHIELGQRFSRSMTQNIDMDRLWVLALREAEADLSIHGEALAADLPAACPLVLREIIADDFTFERGVAAVREP